MILDRLFGTPGALLSDCRKYRYALERVIPRGTGGAALFVMFNPSVADERFDDATVSRCRIRAAAWGCSSVLIGNLFAYIDRAPIRLAALQGIGVPIASEPSDPSRNDEILRELRSVADLVCFAWGAWGDHYPERVREVFDIFAKGRARRAPQVTCLGTTKNGQPRHPLYLHRTAELRPWRPR